jgi:hypothetical protein
VADGDGMLVSVNRLPIAELRQQLAPVPQSHLTGVTAEAILRLRPFADKAVLLTRVSEAVGVSQEFVGGKLVGHFDFTPWR